MDTRQLITDLEAYRTKVNNYCNNEKDFKKSSKHSYISDKISSLIGAIGDFEPHDSEYCPLYGDKILPDEEGLCSLCGGTIQELK